MCLKWVERESNPLGTAVFGFTDRCVCLSTLPTHIYQPRFATLGGIYLECFITSVLKGLLHFWLTYRPKIFFRMHPESRKSHKLTLLFYYTEPKLTQLEFLWFKFY